jgi:hypothetical protein
MADDKKIEDKQPEPAKGDDADASKKAESETDEGKKPDPAEALKAAEARIKALNKESEKHRTRANELDQTLSTLKKAMGLEKQDDPNAAVTAAKAAGEEKQKRILLRSAFTALVAKEAHDADDAFAVANAIKALDLSKVDVDLDAESVDVDTLKAKVGELKKLKPFLFTSASGSGSEDKRTAKPAADGSGRSSTGGTHFQTWKQLIDQGRKQEAQKFYSENRANIMTQMPKT